MRFKLLRYYSLASAFAVVAVTAILVVVYGRYATDSLVTSVEQQNVILASFIGNDLSARFPQHFEAEIHDAEKLATDHHVKYIKAIDAILRDLLKSLPVLKVKAYRDDLTIYSTEHSQIGEIKSSPGFLIARNQGIPASKLSFRGELNSFEGVISNRNIIETYVPLGALETTTGESSRLILEIYTDVTPLVAEIEQSKVNLIAGLIFLFAALYGVLVLIVRRADRVIDRQYEDLNGEITERKQAEEALREAHQKLEQRVEERTKALQESEERLRTILENSPMGIAVVTHAADDTRITGNRLFINEALVKMFGFASAEDMLDADISNSWVDFDQLREVEEIMTGRDELVDYEALRRRVNGTEWWVSMNSRPIRFEGQDCTMVWHFEITERKRAEEALRASEQNYRALFENAAAGIGRSRITDGKVLLANRKLAQIFGYERVEQFIAEFLFIDHYVDPGERERVIARYKEGSKQTAEVSFATRDGSVITVANQGWVDEKAGHIDFVMIDITEHKRAEEALREAHDELETRVEERTRELTDEITERQRMEQALVESEERHRHFSADVAHELRTPLAVLRLHLDNLENTETNQSLIKDVDVMSRLVSQLLAATRLDSLTINSNDEADLHAISTEVAKYLAPLAIKEGRSIEVIGTQFPVIVRGNDDALEMAVRNLVENALRYSTQNTVVTIDVSDDPAISVINLGQSIPPEQRKVIFQRFKRVDRRAGGVGLGLSIVQRVVKAHQATIDVSDAPGGGAVFKISFPSPKSLKVVEV